MNQVLACLDTSPYAQSVADHAAWAAKRLGSSVELLHVIQRDDAVSERHDLSGSMGLGAKSSLLEELVQIDEAHSRIARERGKLLLEAAREQLVNAGVADILTTHRHGGVVETVIEREADADLVVIGKRGVSSQFAAEHLGSRVERVARESTRPVLVASRAFTKPERAMIAFDGGDSARKAVEFVRDSQLLEGVKLDLVMAGRQDANRGQQMAWAQEQLPNATAHLWTPPPMRRSRLSSPSTASACSSWEPTGTPPCGGSSWAAPRRP